MSTPDARIAALRGALQTLYLATQDTLGNLRRAADDACAALAADTARAQCEYVFPGGARCSLVLEHDGEHLLLGDEGPVRGDR